MSYDYKELLVWQKSMDLATCVYQITTLFPDYERFGLTSQLRRSAVSIPSNIAEGQGRRSNGDFVRFLYIANGSRQEAETQLEIARRLGFLPGEDAAPLMTASDEIGKMLFGLINSLEK